MPTLLSEFKHYIGIVVVLLVIYFLFGPMLLKLTDHPAVAQAPVSAPVTSAVNTVADAAKDQVLEAALNNQAVQLSAAQQTIANLAVKAGANPTFASGLVAGLTRPAPTQEVLTASNKAAFVPKTLSQDQLVAAVQTALKTTPLDVTTHVQVSYEDKPLSPFFAAYNFDGATGVGYTFRKAPFLNADALLMAKGQGGTDIGVGVDHILKGTSASIGIDAVYNSNSRRFAPGIFAGIRW